MTESKSNGKKRPVIIALAVILIAACAGGAWYANRQAEIKAMQDQAIAALAELVDPGAYREAEASEIQSIIDSTEAAIRESKDQAEIDALVEKAEAEAAGLKTAAAYTAEEGVAKLKDSVDLDLYREAERNEIQKILDSTEAAINESGDQAEIDALIKKASDQFSEFKTDAEYSAEEAAAAASSKRKKSSGSSGCVGGGADVFN